MPIPHAQPPRPSASRASFLTRITQFPAKPVSVVPYAPERLSITQDVFTPDMRDTLAKAQNARHASAYNRAPIANGGADGATPDNPQPHASGAPNGPRADEPTGNTLFAALKMRRVLQRAKAGRGSLQIEPKIDEAQANVDRHIKVLSRYKIRRVDITEKETTKTRHGGFFMVNPHSTLFKLWQLGTLVIIIYQSIVLPYSLAFGWNQSSVIDTGTNIIFFVDIVFAFNTPIASSADGNEYITDRVQIAKIYFKGWLFFDLLACIPFDTVLVWINNYDNSSSTNLNVLGLLKALRIPRLLRLVRLLRVVKVLKIRPEIRRWLQYSRHANLLRLVRLVLSFLILNHYAACIWFGAVASDETKASDPNKETGHMYIVSFYTTLLVMQGQNLSELYSDTEYLFCTAMTLLGAIVMAVVFGDVAILIANYYENQSSHRKKMEWLFASMSRMKLPLELQNRINDYYQAMWERHGTLDGAVTAFIPELSRNLAYEVELFLRMDMINRAPIFQNCSAKVVQELVMELELQVFMPGDYIVVRGEVGNDMYFVQNGLCEVTKDLAPATTTTASFQQQQQQSLRRGTIDPASNEIILKQLGQGDYFGEIALLMNCKRTANVRAQVFSELCALTRDVFENISLRYLEDRNIIEKFIMDKYDPSMLQAAMKQSHELTMRSSAVGGGGGGGGAPRASILRRVATPGSDGDSLEMLRRIDDRLQKLEFRIDRESKDRRDSEIRIAAMANGPRLSTHSEDTHASPYAPGGDGNGGGGGGGGAEFVLFEPERMSQRHLQLLPLHRGSSKTTQISEIARTPEEVAAAVDGVATQDEPDQKRNVWKKPSVHRSGSWRNARREGSTESLRLRGLVKPLAATHTNHSSRAASLTAAIAAAESVAVHHSSLRKEPSLRTTSIAASEPTGANFDDDGFDGDPDRGMTLSADSLDDLASAFAQSEQRDDGASSPGPPTRGPPGF